MLPIGVNDWIQMLQPKRASRCCQSGLNSGRDCGRFHSRIRCRQRQFSFHSRISTCIVSRVCSAVASHKSSIEGIDEDKQQGGGKKRKGKEKKRTRPGSIKNRKRTWNEGRFFARSASKGQISLSAIAPGSAAKKAKNALVRDARPVRRTHNPRGQARGERKPYRAHQRSAPHCKCKRTIPGIER
ncbi:hypothetical protein BDV38DRAFT_67816 [Aspergillus pseudotamarii]|uniref:Uncharacterized protein n=1 Tax=Aspergillus pseudotamarii TaxID=132259 RepID=A0A5N6TB62_ASPPS|nr:uncharacterized protein BDV38DRAFT_67816 [Aspergillus pseudotamarii]KAE8143510.1 hypothetical protein BDV38DRAFT_67816 [Aspergillus pseudotamarii]